MGGCLSCRLKLVRDQSDHQISLPENLTCFTLKSLEKATNHFDNNVKINEHPSSYKGTLDNGTVVIVVVYSTRFWNYDLTSFIKIIKIMSGVKHQNVVELIGYCIESHHRLLVHNFVGDYRLYDYLFSKSKVKDQQLDWGRRVSICHGIARALDYLHNGISPRVIVRDVKPSNVSIDENFNPKIVAFESSSLLEDDESQASDGVLGTLGYLDPEYARTGRYSEKTDIYGFGITLLEIISGRHCWECYLIDREETRLVDWAWELQKSGRIPDIVDPTLSVFSEEEVIRIVNVALSCIQIPSDLRPSMSLVRLMLSDGYDLSHLVLTRPSTRYRQQSCDSVLSGLLISGSEHSLDSEIEQLRTVSLGSVGSFEKNSVLDQNKISTASSTSRLPAENPGGLNFFEDVSQDLALGVDLFEVPRDGTVASMDLFQLPANSSALAQQFPQSFCFSSSSALSQSYLNPSDLNSNPSLSEPSEPNNEGWATFDLPQPSPLVVNVLDTSGSGALSKEGRSPNISTSVAPSDIGLQWPEFRSSNVLSPLCSVSNPWDEGQQNVHVPTSMPSNQDVEPLIDL